MGEVIEGVYLSTTLDLEAMYAPYFAAHADKVRLRKPEDIDDPEEVRFALAWLPAANAFAPYPNLRLASSIAAGVDSIVNCPSLPKDAVVARIRDENQADFMAGFAAWHVVWHHRNMAHHIRHEARQEWSRLGIDAFIPPRECTVGILGFGMMGQAIARAVMGMGFQVAAGVRSMPDHPVAGVEYHAGEHSAYDVAAVSDILINVLPLTRQTRGLLDARFFAAMKKGAALIQLGRGEHLVERDLVAALDAGHIRSASLDVFEREPLPPEHRFWRDERVLVTPHQACECSPTKTAEQVSEAALAVVRGETPRTAVDRASGY
ncbi:NAD(P)-dependent oxidoreductase [Nitratireductor sp. CH_MIT9313-5]|jgi:glyoxylate/hydroxypyruvate reductase A|uniref:NAD(P)-dependent oxidoreductase n=1 Tax=Nitratireductor sp. CH_MIT9313-5 TaxID=3107764 RepID=UPI00300A3578